MRRLPPSVRALALVPLGTVAVQQARAATACGEHAQSCLEAAGQGWMSWAGIVALLVFAGLTGLGVAALAGGVLPGAPALSVPRLWAVATAVLLLTCLGQDAIARALSPGATPLEGGWPVALALCAGIGLVLALLTRVRESAAALWAALAPAAPRLAAPSGPAPAPHAVPLRAAPRSPLAGRAAGRAPPR